MIMVAEHLFEASVNAGVPRIYGVVGNPFNSIVDAVHHNTRMKSIHVQHEEAGGFAASAEVQLAGNLAVCAGSRGPGEFSFGQYIDRYKPKRSRLDQRLMPRR